MVYLLIALVVVGVLLALLPLVMRRDRRLDEVERFHRARQMTTGWSMTGAHPPQDATRERRGDTRGA